MYNYCSTTDRWKIHYPRTASGNIHIIRMFDAADEIISKSSDVRASKTHYRSNAFIIRDGPRRIGYRNRLPRHERTCETFGQRYRPLYTGFASRIMCDGKCFFYFRGMCFENDWIISRYALGNIHILLAFLTDGAIK